MHARTLLPFHVRLPLVGLLLALALSPMALAAAAPAPLVVNGSVLTEAAGPPQFIVGVNYEGPVDRAWQMWDDGKFDQTLIGRDLDRAKAANMSTVRVFLQSGLFADIRAGKWAKLDQFLNLADQRGLRVILTLADYGSLDVAALANVAGQVAAHYKGRATLLALDLKNEPHFGDLALSTYPPGVNAALRDPKTVSAVGETVARQDITAYRATEQGQKQISARLNDDQAYVYANVLNAYLQFLQEGQAWASSHNATTVQYYQSPDSAKWNPLKEALNNTLAAWLKPQLDAIRAADPNRLVTLAHVDPVLASLPVNAWLDYRTFHRYPTASATGIQRAMALIDAVRAAVPGKPLVLGEFGFPNDSVNEQDSASLEAALVHAVRDHGGAGALKWMLNDVPNNNGNLREGSLGMYRGDGAPKPVVAAFKALGSLGPVAAVTAPAVPHDERYFAQTGFRVDNDAVWGYFQARGSVDIFGYPVSRTFTLLGCQTQMFQRLVAQVCADGRPSLMNLLDPDVFPYTHVNGSTFPAPDPALKSAAPPVADPAYAQKIVDFSRANVPDDAFGQSVGFGKRFFGTVSPAMAGTDNAGLLSLLDLEVWGAPISKPMPDPTNAGFIYQRFQRGIMHYLVAQKSTQSILLADYLKRIIINAPELPGDLRQQAQTSRFYNQYCPGRDRWECRPNDLSGTDLTYAFEPG